MTKLIGKVARWFRSSAGGSVDDGTKPAYPPALDPAKVGSYPASTKSGGGYVWDEVLEYRVWSHPERGAPDECDGSDYCYAFDNYPDALAFSQAREGAENPLVLVLQREHINEPRPGVFEHVTQERITEWKVEWLGRSRRTASTIPDFFSTDAPPNRLEILRGEAD
ncbi:MAG: hypothetical protein AB3N06_05410 [Erythrobacter sp.]